MVPCSEASNSFKITRIEHRAIVQRARRESSTGKKMRAANMLLCTQTVTPYMGQFGEKKREEWTQIDREMHRRLETC